MRIKSPFDVGDAVEFRKDGSGYPKGLPTRITGIGYDSGKMVPWRVKIDKDGSRTWWSAGWFIKRKK